MIPLFISFPKENRNSKNKKTYEEFCISKLENHKRAYDGLQYKQIEYEPYVISSSSLFFIYIS